MPRSVTMGLIFYPRGGSAQVVRYLARALVASDWQTRLACGSLGQSGERTHAESFFAGIAPVVADYNAAIEAAGRGKDPIAQDVPLHPSYEDRPGASDRIFTAVDPKLGKAMERVWRPLLTAAAQRSPESELLHLHHLTPLHGAAVARTSKLRRLPILTHLHGTELKMLDRLVKLTELATALETDVQSLAELDAAHALPDAETIPEELRELYESTTWQHWRHADHWREKMLEWAASSSRLVAISPHDVGEATRLLDVAPERVRWIPNGVDIENFRRVSMTRERKLSLWREWLVTDPQGWTEARDPGALAYQEADLDRFVDPVTGDAAPVLLFVGRFTEVKRLPLLIRAYARARPRLNVRAPLAIWGGFPGEWEGEHPYSVVRRENVRDVFFVGWRGHSELPDGLAAADVMVMPSVAESFGQVFIEAMACGVPVIAANAAGPPSFVNVDPERPNGWLVEPDSLESLTEAIVEAVNNADERKQRGRNGEQVTRADFSWDGIARRTADLYEEMV